MQKADIALLALIGITLLGTIVAAVFAHLRSRRRAELREHFGLEYARAVVQYGNEAEARRELRSRERRVKQLNIRLLSADQCQRFGAAWRAVQERFVDDPHGAVVEANGLVKDVMRIRGYPIGDFNQRLADLSVEHSKVLDHYRAARELALANASGEASTEDLRQAMVHYRALFNDLLQAPEPQTEWKPVRT